MSLSPAQRRFLRALAHPLKPMVRVGAARFTDPLLAEVDRALEDHELIKVKLIDGSQEELQEGRALFEERLGALWVQSVGHTLVLYRRRSKDSRLPPLPAPPKGQQGPP